METDKLNDGGTTCNLIMVDIGDDRQNNRGGPVIGVGGLSTSAETKKSG